LPRFVHAVSPSDFRVCGPTPISVIPFDAFHFLASASVKGPSTPSLLLIRPPSLSAFYTTFTSSPRMYGETKSRFRAATVAGAPAIIKAS
jgi:hypothetical protein